MKRFRRLCGCVMGVLMTCSAQADALLSGGANWPPYTYENTLGEPSGISVEVFQRAMAKLDQPVKLLFYPVNRLNLLLARGELDVNYADSPQWNAPEASQQFVYSDPYLHVREYLYFRPDSAMRSLPLGELRGLRVGAVRGYRYPALIDAYRHGTLIKVETSQEDALLDLLQLGRVDAIAMFEDVYRSLTAARGLPVDAFAQGAQLSDAPLVFKLQRRYAQALPELNTVLLQMVESGEVERIRSDYLQRMPKAVGNR